MSLHGTGRDFEILHPYQQGDVAQFGRASVLHAEGCRFEADRLHQQAGVVQW